MKKILITGGAGFIGYFLSQKLLALGLEVVGIDDLNDYYDPALKQARLDQLSAEPKYSFIKLDLADRTGMERLFIDQQFDIVVNMAPQAGVRYSLTNPHAYADSNLLGFVNLLEGCRHTKYNTCFLPHQAPSMAATPSCHFQYMTMWIIRYHYMPPPRNPMS
jgi:UDP-glucuronate 4-epimerase